MDTDVVISGAGPTGLFLACELALAGTAVRVLERRGRRHEQSRALTLHPRSIEIMDLRGLADRFLSRGRTVPGWHFAGLDRPLDFSRLDTRHGYTLFLEQVHTERILEERARELGVEVAYQHEVTGLTQDDAGVDVRVRTPDGESTVRAAFVVGCDGGDSRVRSSAGIGFPGSEATMTAMLGDFAVVDQDALAAAAGTRVLVVPLEGGLTRFVVTDPDRMRVPRSEPVTVDEFRESLTRMTGSSFGVDEPRWLSRFGNATRLADRYRAGRVFVAGDAAHIHFPAAGQGLNTGLQDAMNLGWKLAAEINGWAAPGLLDSYHTERHAAGRAVTGNTQAQTLLLQLTLVEEYQQPVAALRELLDDLLAIPAANARLAGLVSALDTSYATPGEDPFVGARLAGPPADFALLHGGRFGFLELVGGGAAKAVSAGWGHRVEAATAAPHPGLDDLAEVLVRPDGHIAWVRRQSEVPSDADREAALRRWAGPPSL
ncbi:FAD-dependent monooxygenase [Actinoplanes sp. NPDC049265]|uniref:FAD-dependent monooxygenase n=1 Tax=Actinoplanes sp. NPDC049265 TaxID=3363902 RepID=UPI00371ECED9